MSKEPIERIDWTNKNEAIVHLSEQVELKDSKGNVVGVKTEEIKTKASYEDILGGMKVVEERIKKSEAQLESLEKKLDQFGKSPAITSEMARLKQNIEKITLRGQIEETSSKIEPLKEQIDIDKKFLERRQKLLDARPE